MNSLRITQIPPFFSLILILLIAVSIILPITVIIAIVGAVALLRKLSQERALVASGEEGTLGISVIGILKE